MPRPRVHDDALRTRLLQEASRVVAEDGPARLTVRDVAVRAGTSASAVYALFGAREELLRAVGAEAFRRFAAHLAAAGRTDDPGADLLALGLAYRESALADPHFYRVMFDTAGVGAREASGGPASGHPTFATLRTAVARVLRGHGVPDHAADDAAEPAALALWGLVHGLVELELGGCCRARPPSAPSGTRRRCARWVPAPSVPAPRVPPPRVPAPCVPAPTVPAPRPGHPWGPCRDPRRRRVRRRPRPAGRAHDAVAGEATCEPAARQGAVLTARRRVAGSRARAGRVARPARPAC